MKMTKMNENKQKNNENNENKQINENKRKVFLTFSLTNNKGSR